MSLRGVLLLLLPRVSVCVCFPKGGEEPRVSYRRRLVGLRGAAGCSTW
jgi:hypothetical protein